MLVVIGVQRDGSKRFLALESGYRESKESWALVLRQLKVRGVKSARLFVGDGTWIVGSGWGDVSPGPRATLLESQDAQRDGCGEQEGAGPSQGSSYRHDVCRESTGSIKERKKFEQAFRHNPKAIKTVVENWERLTSYYDFPREHWKHLRTSNVVESPFSRVRLRTAASRRFKSQVNATCLIWKTLMVAEMSFRKLNAPNLVEKVAEGKKIRVWKGNQGRRLIPFYPPIDEGFGCRKRNNVRGERGLPIERRCERKTGTRSDVGRITCSKARPSSAAPVQSEISWITVTGGRSPLPVSAATPAEAVKTI